MDVLREFPGLHATTYLNSCAYGLLPHRSRAAVEKHLDVWSTAPSWDRWNEAIEAARRAFARLIGARDDEVSIQANASSGIASIMSALQPSQRRVILTCDIDFPTAPFLAERQKARGFEHRHLRSEDRFLRADAWARHLAPEVALACIPSVASFSGYKLDVGAFAERARAAGVPLLVDAFQGAGTYPMDVRRLDVDFLVTGVYKWLLGPVGLAFLYVRRDHHDLVPTTTGWYGSAEPYAFDPMDELAPDARRFQYGGASVMGCVAAAASLSLIDEVGVSSIARTNGALLDRVLEQAAERGYEILTPSTPEDRASIATFRVPDLDASLAACARANVIVNSRLAGIRVSPHFYNSAADVDRLFDVLDGVSA